MDRPKIDALKLCASGSPINVGNDCIRAWWTAGLPTAVVIFSLIRILYKRLPDRFKPLSSTLSNFLPLDEAISMQKHGFLNGGRPAPAPRPTIDDYDIFHAREKSRWKRGILIVGSAFEALYWIFWSCRLIIDFMKGKDAGQDSASIRVMIIMALLLSFSWVYAAVRPVFIRSQILTVPYDLFTFYLSIFAVTGLNLGTILYEQYVNGKRWHSHLREMSYATATAFLTHLFILAVLIATTLALRMSIPPQDSGVDYDEIGKTVSPEDYTRLWSWITFWWIYPMVKKGTGRTLKEEEVWPLSPTFACKPLFTKFQSLLSPSQVTKNRMSLLKQLWKANSLDMILDFLMTLTSVICNYASPFFLKKILDAVSQPSTVSGNPSPSLVTSSPSFTWLHFLNPREVRAQAYVYAFLAFLASILKAQSDVQHLWYGRRASTRIRSELMAAIFEKSLKRKDFSGSVDKNSKLAAGETEGKGKGKEPAKEKSDSKKPDTKKAGADIGKIVNLMSNDANRVSNTAAALYMLYGAPLELVVGSIFLYQLLGFSGFAGYIILVVGSPLNNYLMRRGRDIQRAAQEARDKRMKVLNELVSEAKFIKFGAGENKWIEKCLAARAVELKLLIKSTINSLGFSITWSMAPVLVSIVSFTVYVYTGNRLTVSVAFTAIQIFSMIKGPMNIIPAFMAMLLSTQVALDRINQYLNEEDVPPFVSSLIDEEESPQSSAASSKSQKIGIENGWFRWNQAIEPVDTSKSKGHGWRFWKRWTKKEQIPSLPTTAATTTQGTDHTRENTSTTLVDTTVFELQDINIIFPTEKLTVVTGPTAAGKSALLMALLGEMTPVEEGNKKSHIYLPKHIAQIEEQSGLRNCIAYCAQSPWLEHLTIRDNILFGSPFDQERYDQVIEQCALKPDLQILEDGDMTEIGARGVSLSGGQKARVALARAVYARSKHVLLDDPLSAVDSHTARHLVEKLIQGPLMANRTIILVTHHVDLVLSSAYYFVRMLDGRIDTQGTITELRSRGLLDSFVQDAQAEQQPEIVTAEELAIVASEESPSAETAKPGEPPVKIKKPRKLVEAEERAEGAVKWSVYTAYFKATGYLTWFLILIILALSQLGGVCEKLWMQVWGESGGATNVTSQTLHFTYLQTTIAKDYLHPDLHRTFVDSLPWNTSTISSSAPATVSRGASIIYVGIFACIGIGIVFINLLGQIVLAIGAYRASKRLFTDLLQTVMHCTMRWFDTTPTGRILNRFSKDIETVDGSISYSLRSTLSWIAMFIAAVVTITIIFPGFIVPGVVIGFFYYKLSQGYMDAGRDLRRMDSTSRSPIFAAFGETLEGIVTVRAFAAERRFMDTLYTRVDESTKYWYTFWMLNRWLLLNFDALGAMAVLITTLLVLGGWISDWLAGLTITSAMNFTNAVYWTCRMITQLELDLNSVERVVEYLNLPQEPPEIIEDRRPPAYWPALGSNDQPMISVNKLVIKYAPNLPDVLHGVSFEVKPREKIGLLGRTGSGKSTLAMSLLRFVDPAAGTIIVDGIDVTKIGLHDLRTRITFIPQDSVLFSGTIRENLDPFTEHTDEECLDALYRVDLISEATRASRRSTRPPSINEAPEDNAEPDTSTPPLAKAPSVTGTATPLDDRPSRIDLDTEVTGRGANFSQGQRQLISMARALLRQSSIVILDEATSSIDFQTDAKIQAAVREEFKNSCLLTIAHRIRTVIDYDRLLILDKGNVVEFDTPLNLIQKEGGLFRDMCLKSGMFSELEKAAKQAAADAAEGRAEATKATTTMGTSSAPQ
ncbi:hypothetical protein FRC19_001616 [Serendipita sp. 401]|nr:hypothetical protein FRC19_001616 [Serendipita sp. 401]